jgi:hypothetical protein
MLGEGVNDGEALTEEVMFQTNVFPGRNLNTMLVGTPERKGTDQPRLDQSKRTRHLLGR